MPTTNDAGPTWAGFITDLPDPREAARVITGEATRIATALTIGDVATASLSLGDGYTYAVVIARLDPVPRGFYGDLLVALPEFHAAVLLAANGFHVPGYISEKMTGLPATGCHIIAALTTAVSERLT